MKKIISFILVAATCAALFAELKIGGSVVAKFDLYRFQMMRVDGRDNDNVKNSAFNGFNFGDTNFFVEYSTVFGGARFALNPDDVLAAFQGFGSETLGPFDGTYAWLNFGENAKYGGAKVGIFGEAHANKFNDIVDDWSFGPILAEPDNGDKLKEIDLLRNVIVYANAGPVKIELMPIGFNKDYSLIHLFTSEKYPVGGSFETTVTNPSTDKDTIDAMFGVRVSAPILDYANLTAIYKFGYDFLGYDRDNGAGVESSSNYNTENYNHHYGIIAETEFVKGLGLALGYSGYLKTQSLSWNSEKVTLVYNKYHSVELRVRYAGVPGLVLETHNNFSFGMDVGKKFTGTTKVDGKRPDFFAAWNALAASYQITEKMSVKGEFISKYEQSKKDADNIGTSLAISFAPYFKYAFMPNLFAEIGVKFLYEKRRGVDAGVKEQGKDRYTLSLPVKVSVSF